MGFTLNCYLKGGNWHFPPLACLQSKESSILLVFSELHQCQSCPPQPPPNTGFGAFHFTYNICKFVAFLVCLYFIVCLVYFVLLVVFFCFGFGLDFLSYHQQLGEKELQKGGLDSIIFQVFPSLIFMNNVLNWWKKCWICSLWIIFTSVLPRI